MRDSAILDSLVEGCQVIGFDWRYLYVNDAYLDYAHRKREELLGRTMSECYPGSETTPQHQLIERCMRERTPQRMLDDVVFPNGSAGRFEVRCIPVDDGVCVLSCDIAARMRSEDARHRADETLRLLIDSLKDFAIYMLCPAGRILTWNAGAERVLGYTAAEVLGRSFTCFSPPEAATDALAELEVARESGRAVSEGWRLRKGGKRFWAQMITTPIHDADGRHVGFAKVTRDLTESHKLEEQFRQAQKMEAIGRLAGGVAHDFNNLLSVILSYAELAVESLRAGDPMRDDMQEIVHAGKRAAELTGQLLAFSRQQVLQPKVLDLNHSLRSMDKMLRRLLGEDIDLRTIGAPALWKVKVDPGQIEQIIMNLAVNARDAMPAGGKLTIETANVELDEEYARVHVGTRPGEYVMIGVSDNGCGMDDATRARIFEPFFTTKAVGKGTGLGLSTVFGIVKQSGGSVFVYSEPGQGTTFKIYIPRTRAAGEVEAAPSVRPVWNGSETILLVEDDLQVRQLLVGILRRHGYTALVAATPADALAIAADHPTAIDLLLTDVVMPGMNGRKLAERMATIRPEMKIVYISGYTDNAMVDQGLLQPNEAFVQKPITPETITRKLRSVLDGDQSGSNVDPTISRSSATITSSLDRRVSS